MKKWLLSAIVLVAAWAPGASRAGPIVEIGLEFVSFTTQISGDPTNNYVTASAPAGSIGQSFSGTARASGASLAMVLGFGGYDDDSGAWSVNWNARFRVNQPGIKVDIGLSFLDSGWAVSSGWAKSAESTSVSVSVNGVQRLSDHQSSSCNTISLDCEDASGNASATQITLDKLFVGQLIDISGSLSAAASTSAGPFCGSPANFRSCLGLGFGQSTASFTITAIPEPSSATLAGAGLLVAGVMLRRRGHRGQTNRRGSATIGAPTDRTRGAQCQRPTTPPHTDGRPSRTKASSTTSARSGRSTTQAGRGSASSPIDTTQT
jgi:hypothetical protein